MSARTLSPESREELESLLYELHKNGSEQLRYDTKAKSYRWYKADATDFWPEQLPGFTPDPDEQEQIREQLEGQALVSSLHREEDEAQILRRWNRPDDELDVLEQLDATNSRGMWTEAMTDFRRTQLHVLCVKYFGTPDYINREIVLRWEQSGTRWVPAEKMLVRDWIESKVEEKGSKLAGFASCAGTLRRKLVRREPQRNYFH